MFTNGNGDGSHFDNPRFEEVVVRFQKGDTAALAEIVELAQSRALTLIRFNGTTSYRTESELLSDINFKLLRTVGKFDPRKGTAFTYVSKIIDSSLRTSVTITRKNWLRNCELNDELANTLHASVDDHSSVDDLAHRIRCEAKTMLTKPLEIEAQRWFVDSFCDDGFGYRRHQCADACMAVYQLSHARSRELYDLTMLEVRRALYDSVKHRDQIIPGRLLGTRCGWMAQYSPLLSGAEFTRFAVLMKNLAPYLLLLIVDPANNRNHRRDRCPTIGRKNIELILYGSPDAVPLFE
jgi:hypothetical protein